MKTSELPKESANKKASPTKKKVKDMEFKKTGQATVRNRFVWEAVGHEDSGITLYWADRGHGNDAYTNPVAKAIISGELREHGFILQVGMRISLALNELQSNNNNGYIRKIYVRTSEGSTPQLRLEGAKVLQRISMLPENNRYGSVFSADPCDDRTVIPFRSPDHLITDSSIVDLVYAMYDDVDTEWFTSCSSFAASFFSRLQPYPRCAITRLGYPELREDETRDGDGDGDGEEDAESVQGSVGEEDTGAF